MYAKKKYFFPESLLVEEGSGVCYIFLYLYNLIEQKVNTISIMGLFLNIHF